MRCITLSLAACLYLANSVAFAIDADKAAPSNANVFDGPLTVAAGERPSTADEDLSSPLVESHAVEQTLYADRYYARYKAASDDGKAVLGELTTATDPDGRPLWFDEPFGGDSLKNLVGKLITNQQFDDVDRLFDDWSDRGDRMADGQWMLMAFDGLLSDTFGKVVNWDGYRQFIINWRSQRPKSRAAALAEAIYWIDYAWSARGPFDASTVSDEGRRLFDERLRKADSVLQDCKPYAASSPLWGYLKLNVGIGLNEPKDVLLAEFWETAAKAPYFYPLYSAMATALTPQWGGDWKVLDDFVKAAVKNTQSVEGRSIYARIYWSVAGHGIFNYSKANWPEMKASMEDMIQRYPHSGWLLNKYASYACLAEDETTFVQLRLRIGKAIVADAWPIGRSLDLCERRFPGRAL
jgi:hypothetical protein